MSFSSTDRLNCVELFAGAGGLTEGFRQVGIRTLVANELHKDASKTFRKNHPEVDLITRDIHDVKAEEILGRASQAAGHHIGADDVDVLAGGPPCQGFSYAGLKQVHDPRNQLVWQQLRLVEAIRPKFVVIENVPGMMRLHGGVLPDLVKMELEKLGYRVEYRLLEAVRYGVPQMRKRLIFLANRVGAPIRFPEATHYGPALAAASARKPVQGSLFDRDGDLGTAAISSSGCGKYVTVGEAISDLDFLEAGEVATEYRFPPQTAFQKETRGGSTILYNHQATRHGKRTIAYFSHMIPGGSIETIPTELLTKKTGIQRWHPDRISRAVVTAFEDFVHYRANRIPTVREVARLQTFPDSYEFLGQRTSGNQNRRFNYSSQTQQVSNAVPPKMAAAIGQALASAALVAN